MVGVLFADVVAEDLTVGVSAVGRVTILWPSEVWIGPCFDDDIGIAVVVLVVVGYALIDGITGLGIDGEGGVVGLRGVVEQG